METVTLQAETAEGNSYPDLEKICLLCLREDAGTIEVFAADEQSIPLRIMACTSLEVSPAGSMPKLICNDCRIQLERSYYFRKRAQYSYNKLKKHIRLITIGKKSRVFDKTEDEDDEIDFGYSLNFLKAIEDEERLKRECELKELEEQLKERFRIEETNRIFEEARNFLNTKASEYLKTTSAKSSTKIESMQDYHLKTERSEHENIIQSPSHSESEKDVGEEVSHLNELPEEVNETNEKIFKFAYSDTNEDALEGFYLIKHTEDEEMDEETNHEHIDEIEDDPNNMSDLSVVELQENEDKTSEGPIESINLDDCSLNDTMDNSVNMFAGKSDHENLIEESTPSMDEDESSNHSQIALAAAIQKSLLSQENLKLNGNIKFKVEQVMDGVTHVKVITEEGNVIDIEVQNESEADSLIEKSVGSNEELKIFKCNLCPQAFTRRSLMLRHKSVHVKSTGYCCKFCQKWFACKSSMNRHIRVHTGEKPFECDQCGRKFIQKEILKRHMVIHTGVRPYPCPHCDKAFVQKQLLRQHINLKHTDNPVVEMHECFLCPKSFCHASGLSRHLLVHSGVSYQCKKCGKKFNDKSAVKRHTMTVHAKARVLKVDTDELEQGEKSRE